MNRARVSIKYTGRHRETDRSCRRGCGPLSRGVSSQNFFFLLYLSIAIPILFCDRDSSPQKQAKHVIRPQHHCYCGRYCDWGKQMFSDRRSSVLLSVVLPLGWCITSLAKDLSSSAVWREQRQVWDQRYCCLMEVDPARDLSSSAVWREERQVWDRCCYCLKGDDASRDLSSERQVWDQCYCCLRGEEIIATTSPLSEMKNLTIRRRRRRRSRLWRREGKLWRSIREGKQWERACVGL